MTEVCFVFMRLTQIRLESISSTAGGYLLTELTVNGGALEVGAAATRLLRLKVFKRLHKTLTWKF